MTRRRMTYRALCILSFLGVASLAKWGWNCAFENPTHEIESLSHSPEEAARRGTLYCRVRVMPNPVQWKEKTIRFRDAWVEARFLDSHLLVWFPYSRKIGGFN